MPTAQVVGASEKALRRFFARARSVAPAVLLLDNIEHLGGKRGPDSTSELASDRLLSTLLVELDGVRGGAAGGSAGANAPIVVIGISARPSLIDPALLRPGRLDVHIEVNAPDSTGRAAILRTKLATVPHRCARVCVHHGRRLIGVVPTQTPTPLRPNPPPSVPAVASLTESEVERIAEVTDGATGAELEALCRESAMEALRADITASEVDMRHVRAVLAGGGFGPGSDGMDGGDDSDADAP